MLDKKELSFASIPACAPASTFVMIQEKEFLAAVKRTGDGERRKANGIRFELRLL